MIGKWKILPVKPEPRRVKPTRSEFLVLLTGRLGVVSVRLFDHRMGVCISAPFQASGAEALARECGLETFIGDNLAELQIFGFRREPTVEGDHV